MVGAGSTTGSLAVPDCGRVKTTSHQPPATNHPSPITPIRPILTHGRATLSGMSPDLLPASGPLDMRAIHRTALSRVADALRRGRIREAVRWGRVVKRARRTLRYAARIRAGAVRNWVFDDSLLRAHPHSLHPLFFAALQIASEPGFGPEADRRRRGREGRWRW